MSSEESNGVGRKTALEDIVLAYLEQRQAGQAPDRQALLARHPEYATDLAEFFANDERVGVVADGLRQAVLGNVAMPGLDQAAEHSLATVQTFMERNLAALGQLGDFRLVREIGRGGMGVVYEAEQISLGRRVALKVLPFAATMDPRQLQRFKNEAHAAAQLHHTNIVPVYSVGCERGVHFYAMQYIEGHSLAQVIVDLSLQTSDLKKGREADASPAAAVLDGAAPTTPHIPERVEQSEIENQKSEISTKPLAALSTVRSTKDAGYFRTVAQLGIQAAEALDYAHQQGIVHRDVKPANLMVDSDARLWITDFGLAQVQSDTRLTMSGDLVGTLRYMSPEQALAKRVIVDHRTDIYSLGATLYELLTLEPVFGGNDRQELLRQIAFEEPRPPRQLNRAIPVELETIVLMAMEKSTADRYATAQVLADDLRRYLTHEPIQARRASLVQRTRKMARRHPGVTITAAVAVVVGLLLGVTGLAVNNRMVRQEQLRTQDALNRAEQQKAIAEAVRDFLRNNLLAQADPRAQADARLRRGGKSGSDPDLTVRELLDQAALELAPNEIDKRFRGQPLVQAEILRTIGEAYSGIGEYKLAIPHLERARDLHVRELGPDHADTLATMDSLGTACLGAGKNPEAAHLLKQVHALRSETLGPDHPDTLASMHNVSRAYFALGWHAEALELREEIVRLRKAKLGPDHSDTLQSMNNLANSYAMVRRYEDARQLHGETLARRQATLGPDHQDTLDSVNNLANCYTALDQYADALKLHQVAWERRRSNLGADNPHTLKSMNNVAFCYAALGRHAEALKLYEKTLAGREAKLGLDHPDTLFSMNTLAWLLATVPDRALQDHAKALELAQQAVKRAPEKGDYWNTVGVACYRCGDWKGTIAALEKSIKLRKGGDSTDWFFLAMAHERLGDKGQGRRWYERAVQWMEKNKPADEELRRFRAEAAELLKIEKE